MASQKRRPTFIKLVIGATFVVLLLVYSAVATAENPWVTPNRSTFPFSDDEYAELDAMMRPCSDHARETLEYLKALRSRSCISRVFRWLGSGAGSETTDGCSGRVVGDCWYRLARGLEPLTA
jgi:hypothetical protein